MRGLIRQVLTRRRITAGAVARKVRVEEELPKENLVILVQFSIVVIAALSIVEVVHVVFLKTWNENVFNAIVGLIGTVTGIIIGRKA